jgi:predicted component of type VI protein secretion system
MAETLRMAEAITAFLICRLGDGTEEVIVCDTAEVRVGRLSTQDLVVSAAGVSREHAAFQCEAGSWWVRDCESALGTLVNGEPIQFHRLSPGDEVEVGPLSIGFALSPPAPPPGPTARLASSLGGKRPRAAGHRWTTTGDAGSRGVATAPQRPAAHGHDWSGSVEDLGASEVLPPLGEATLQTLFGPDGASTPSGGAGSGAAALDLDDTPTNPGVRPGAEQSVRLEVELEGSPAAIETLAGALTARIIRWGGVTVRVRRGR